MSKRKTVKRSRRAGAKRMSGMPKMPKGMKRQMRKRMY